MRGLLAAYQFLGWTGLVLASPVLAVRALRDSRYRVGWPERLGSWGTVNGGGIWVHGASVGEILAASPLVAALRERQVPLVITATNPSGRDTARGLVGPQDSAHLAPLDLTLIVRRALRAARPKALVVVETELWPALFWEAHKSGVPVLVVNGRISARSFPRYRRLRRWLAPLLRTLAGVQAQSAADAERFLALGAVPDRVSVAGNLKYDLPPPDASDASTRALRRARAGGWRVVLGGSTHPGEEEALLDAVRRLSDRVDRIGLVLVPRHLERLREVEDVIRQQGRGVRRWNDLADPLEAGILAAFGAGDVVLVDRYGLLSNLYGGSECAFVGGSLVPIGGHNLLEPLNWGVPAVFGPHTENARDLRNEIVNRGLGTEVTGAADLANALERYLREPGVAERVREEAQALFEANRGAVERAVAALEELGALRSTR